MAVHILCRLSSFSKSQKVHQSGVWRVSRIQRLSLAVLNPSQDGSTKWRDWFSRMSVGQFWRQLPVMSYILNRRKTIRQLELECGSLSLSFSLSLDIKYVIQHVSWPSPQLPHLHIGKGHGLDCPVLSWNLVLVDSQGKVLKVTHFRVPFLYRDWCWRVCLKYPHYCPRSLSLIIHTHQ